MTRKIEAGGLAPTQSRAAAKGEATTKAALEIIEQEAAARVAKTERLRVARLAHEAAAIPATAAPKKGRGKR